MFACISVQSYSIEMDTMNNDLVAFWTDFNTFISYVVSEISVNLIAQVSIKIFINNRDDNNLFEEHIVYVINENVSFKLQYR